MKAVIIKLQKTKQEIINGNNFSNKHVWQYIKRGKRFKLVINRSTQ